MEGIKGGGGRIVGVGEVDEGDGMQCIDHPYRNNPGGICAFCLQEKLGKLVSSSFPLPSTTSSPSFRSDTIASSPTPPPVASSSLPISSWKSRLPFLLANKPNSNNIILNRSKSTATDLHSMVHDEDHFTSTKRNGFWSFLYLFNSKSSGKKFNSKSFRDTNNNNVTSSTTATAKLKEKSCSGSSLGTKHDIVVEQDNSPNSQTATSFERKVSRSKSVGCGSRSFSADFFDRISTGFGDCTLRRVESQREGKHKVASAAVNRSGDHHCMKERVRCAGIFSGFIMTSSYWVKQPSVALSHSRGKSWNWAFASPMTAFGSKASSMSNENDNKNAAVAAAAAAIPSLLAARG